MGDRLTLRGSRNALVLPLCLALLSTAYGLYELMHGDKMQAGLFCLVALSQMVTVPALWKCYLLVRQGTAVYAPAQAQPYILPKAVSVAAILILTGFVATSSAVVVLFTSANLNTRTGWAIAGLILLLLWLLCAYHWYRIVTEKRLPVPATTQEQPESVWPPAPLTGVGADDKD